MKPTQRRASAVASLLIGAAAIAGCGGAESGEPQADPAGSSSAQAGAASNTAGGASSAGSASTSVGALVQAASAAPRKIIYTAQVDLVVENLTSAQEKLLRLVKASGGYISDTTISGESGSQRSGTWKARVPVERYDAFMAGAARLGELQSVRSESQDVTAEYYDVAARIANKQVEEKRLRRHLESSTGKLSEILQVERELSRVRGEIEQAQGRIRVLANLSALTTVTLSMQEIKDYVPPAPPSFATEVGRQFAGSLGALREAGKGIILAFVALAPWLVVLALIGLPARRLWRRLGQAPRGR